MASGSTEDRALFKRTQFHYAVFDEGHMLKNMTSLRYQALMKIKVRYSLTYAGMRCMPSCIIFISVASLYDVVHSF